MVPKSVKVLCFDGWTKGAEHFVRLCGAFNENNVSLQLIHLGSWGNDQGREKEEIIGCITTRDISYYNGLSFNKIIEIEKPNAVLFLSTTTLAHRAFNRICLCKGIPTVNLFHGLASVQLIGTKGGSYKINFMGYIKFMVSRIKKMFKLTLPCYVNSLIVTKAGLNDSLFFLKDLLFMLSGRTSIKYSPDARTTKCCVYTKSDIDYACQKYGFSEKDVKAVGNPDLIKFGFSKDLMGYKLNEENIYKKIVYLDTALFATGLIFNGQDEFLKHLKYTARILSDKNIKLLFKPHPAHNFGYIRDELLDGEIVLIDNYDLIETLMNSDAVITETSSLAIIPALLGMPLFLASYGKLEDLKFGKTLTNYPRSYNLNCLPDIDILIKKDRDYVDRNSVGEWIEHNCGPLPADEMPVRVLQVIKSVINN